MRPRDKALLEASPLFDLEWYAAISGRPLSKHSAVEHYLKTGRLKGLTPHPLFDPSFYVEQEGDRLGDEDPFVHYLKKRIRKASPHPLFDVSFYAAANPEAHRHPGGVLGHYTEIGAPAGLSPNDWYQPDLAREPRGLLDWVIAQRDQWLQREKVRRRWTPTTSREAAHAFIREHGSDVTATSRKTALVSVVVPVGTSHAMLRETVDSIQRQTLPDWELLLLTDQSTEAIGSQLGGAADHRIRVLVTRDGGLARQLGAGLAEARGEYLAWIYPGARWATEHLQHAIAVLSGGDADATYDIVESTTSGSSATSGKDGVPAGKRFVGEAVSAERLAAGWYADLSALVVTRSCATQVGGFDESLPRAADHDFFLKVARRCRLRFVPVVGVHATDAEQAQEARPSRDQPLLDYSSLDEWHDVVLNRHLVDWEALARREQLSDLVTVVIPTHDDWSMTTRAVRRLHEARQQSQIKVRIVVVNNGGGLTTSVVLESLPLRIPDTKIISLPVNHGFALGNNLALPEVAGDVVVFLNNDTEVTPAWLDPLVGALREPDVLGAQSLLVYPSGSIQSAGIAFPDCGGIPHAFLQRFPVEDAVGLETVQLSALTAAALAMRFSDVVALRGFDPLFRNGMEDVDLGLRMKRLRTGYFTVRPDSLVVHHESKSPGRRLKIPTNRRLLLDRWGGLMPGDDGELWNRVGFDLVGHRVQSSIAKDPRVGVPEPVLSRKPKISVKEPRPAFRWAIKNPAPSGPKAEIWGDTHFTRRLAESLRKLGQHVAIDHRPEFDRPTGNLDDVVLVLRGLVPYQPRYGQVNLLWLISHPEMYSRAEASLFDRVLAASVIWSQRTARHWGMRIDPLLQATDPALFHPGRGRPDTGHPVLFVGNSRNQLRPLVRDSIAAGLPISVYGPGWEGLIPAEYVKALWVPYEELAAAYRSAGVVLNDHWEDMRADGFISNRVFDAVASGARVVTDDVAGLDGLFGRSVQVARDSADLVRLTSSPDLDSIFGDDEERRKAAARVHAEHSFDVRAARLLEVAIEEWSAQSQSRRQALRVDQRTP